MMLKSTSVMRGFRPALIASAAILAAALSGCETLPENLVPPPSPMSMSEPVRADWVEAQHQVPFAGNETRLSPTAAADIDAFLRRIDFGAGDRIAVTGESLGAPAAVRRIIEQRRTAVIRHLNNRRVQAVPADMVATGANVNVALRIGRYVAVLPDCPDWQRLRHGGGFVDSGHRNFGCMTDTAFGHMVIDPGDLAGGDRTGPGDAVWLAKGVQNYRDGKVQSSKSTAMQ